MAQQPTPPPRGPRSDAIANRERVLAAAALAVTARGEKVPMAEIAHDAGVGVGTLYRHFPTREKLMAGLTHRSFHLALEHARGAAEEMGPAIESLRRFLEQTIARRQELILPLHGGPVILDAETIRLRAEIREALADVLARGRRDGTVRADVDAEDIIVSGALLAQPLPHVDDWDRIARRQAHVFLAGLAATGDVRLPGRPRRAS
jgi:AcrR family transcriptional regulator